MKLRRSSALVLVAGALVLSACSNSAPPATELADEMIDTLDISETQKGCMKSELEGFELTEEEVDLGFTDLDKVAEVAADNDAGGRERALEIMQRFQDALASCVTAG